MFSEEGSLEISYDYSTRADFILNLPDELLDLVIDDVARIEPPSDTYLPTSEVYLSLGRNETLGVLRLSEVCQRFRAVLLSMSLLWGRIALHLPREPGILALSRAKDAPLHIFVRSWSDYRMSNAFRPRYPYPSTAHLSDMAAGNIARLSSLKTDGLYDSEYKTIFERPLPLLDHIDLATTWPQRGLLDSICIDAPVLKSARFLFLNLNTDPFIALNPNSKQFALKLPMLRLLEVVLGDMNGVPASSLRWLANCLQSSPLLEILSIEYKGPAPIDWEDILQSHHIQLAHLRSLHFTGQFTDHMPSLLERVCKHRPSQLSITVKNNSPNMRDFVNTMNAFTRMLQDSAFDGLLVRFDTRRHALEIAAFPALAQAQNYSPALLKELPHIASLSICNFPTSAIPIFWHATNLLTRVVGENSVRQLIIDAPGVDDADEQGEPRWLLAVRLISASCVAVQELVIVQHWRKLSGLLRFPELPAFPRLEVLTIRLVVDDASGYGHWSLWWEEFLERLRHRPDKLHVLRLDVGQDIADQSIYTRAAEFVDELLCHDDRRWQPNGEL